jgi:hypothetical protein
MKVIWGGVGVAVKAARVVRAEGCLDRHPHPAVCHG